MLVYYISIVVCLCDIIFVVYGNLFKISIYVCIHLSGSACAIYVCVIQNMYVCIYLPIYVIYIYIYYIYICVCVCVCVCVCMCNIFVCYLYVCVVYLQKSTSTYNNTLLKFFIIIVM